MVDGQFWITLDPIFGYFVKMYSLVRDHSENSRKARLDAYSTIFVPAFDNLDKAHKDYLLSFGMFIEDCKKFNTPNRELLAKFRSYKLGCSFIREDVRAFAETSAALSRRFQRPQQREAVSEFGTVIAQYFHAALPDGGSAYQSWFTSLLNLYEDCVTEGRSAWDSHFQHDVQSLITNGPTKASFIDLLQRVRNEELPSRWAAVSASKDKIRSTFAV